MTTVPTLRTDRLLLRQFQLSDATDVQRLAGVKEVAAGTLVNFAIVLPMDHVLIGSIGLDIAPGHQHARVGYWLGVPYWNYGYGTEAVNAVLAYGFNQRHLTGSMPRTF